MIAILEKKHWPKDQFPSSNPAADHSRRQGICLQKFQNIFFIYNVLMIYYVSMSMERSFFTLIHGWVYLELKFHWSPLIGMINNK